MKTDEDVAWEMSQKIISDCAGKTDQIAITAALAAAVCTAVYSDWEKEDLIESLEKLWATFEPQKAQMKAGGRVIQ